MEEKSKKNKRIGRKILKGVLISFGCLIVIIAILIAFAPKIVQAYINSESGKSTVNEIVSDYLNAKIEYDEAKLKIWRALPDVEVELINSEIISKAITQDLTDTILKFDTLRLSVNLMKIIKTDSIIINEAYLSHPIANTYINTEGKANWDIYISDTTPDEDTTSFVNKIIVKRLFIENLKASYRDESSQMTAMLDSTDIDINGEISAEIINLATKLKLQASYEDSSSNIQAQIQPTSINLCGNFENGDYNINTSFGKITTNFCDKETSSNIIVDSIGLGLHAILTDSTYDLNTKLNILLSEYKDKSLKIKDIPIDLDLIAQSNADFNKFYIDTLSLKSTDILFGAGGTAENMADSSWYTDLTVALDISHIDRILEKIPPSLVSELKEYQISGAINLNGTANGTYKGNKYPDIYASVKLIDIRTVVLEQNAEVKFDMDTEIKYMSERKGNSYVNIKKLNANVGENYFDVKGKATNILDNPYIDGSMKCDLDLDYISKLFPIEGTIYKGKVKSDIIARFSLNDVTNMNLEDIYMYSDIKIGRILLRIPAKGIYIFGKNAQSNIGINSVPLRKNQNILQLLKATIEFDTARIVLPHLIDGRASRLGIFSHITDPINGITNLGGHIVLKDMQAIVSDTMFISGKGGEVWLNSRPDTTDSLIPSLKARILLDTISYYDPTMDSYIDSLRIVVNGHPRIVKFKEENGKLVEIDQSKRTIIDTDSLIRLCDGIKDAETLLERFGFDGTIGAKAIRYISHHTDLKMGTRRVKMNFTDDTLHLNNMMLRTGVSVLRLNGRIDNIRHAYTDGQTLSANLSITTSGKDKKINLNELLYAYAMEMQGREKYNMGKAKAQGKAYLTNFTEIEINPPAGLNDSARTHYIDSVKRAYRRKDLFEIYNERIHKMRNIITEADDNELTTNIKPETHDSTENDTAMSLIIVPPNLNCKLNLNLDTVLFGGFVFNELKGDLTVKDGTLAINDMNTKSNIGDLKLNATYSCNNLDSANVGLDIFGTSITVENLRKAMPTIDSILPMIESFEGEVDCEMSAITTLDKNIEPILPTLQTACHINGKNLVLLDGETFTTVAKYLMFKKKTKNMIDNMSVEFTIDNNTLSVYPFTLSMDKYKVAVSGRMDFDFKYFFHISVLEPKALPIPLGINIQTKEKKKNDKTKDNKDEEEGELAEESDDFQYRLVKPLYKDEKSITQSINLVNKTGAGRISLQQNLRSTIQNIIKNYEENTKKE